MMPDRDLMLRLQRESVESRERLRAVLRDEGREDLIHEFDRKMWEIETGVEQARSTWAALTATQQRVMVALYDGRVLRRESGSATCYEAISDNGGGLAPTGRLCRVDTVSALLRRDLLARDGLVDDPMRRLVLTKKGAFVVKRGRPAGE